MAQEFRLPDIGEGLVEAEVVRWLVAVGEKVEVDQPVVEVESDKASIEMPSPFAGVLLQQGAAEGETLAVGKILFVVGTVGETWDAAAGTDQPQADQPVEADEPVEADRSGAAAAPIVGSLSEEARDLTPTSPPEPTATGRPRALPAVRKLAADLGVDLAAVVPSGPGGRITRDDVEAAARPAAAPSPPAPVRPAAAAPSAAGEARTAPGPPSPATPSALASPATPSRGAVPASGPLVRKLAAELGVDVGSVVPSGPGGRVTRDDVEAAARAAGSSSSPSGERRVDDERRPMSRLRRTIAANMSRAWAEIPRVTAFDDVDATRLLAVRRALQSRHGVKIPIDALVVAAVVPALGAFPELNATLDGDDLVVHHRHDIGVAVDTPEGLMVAVLRDAGAKGVLELAAEVRRLGEQARSRSLTVDQLTGQTFTVSNIGAVGGGFGTPMVPPATVGILSVGRAREQPVARQGRVEVAPVMPLSFSFDHRVADGAAGRGFLANLMENLAEPALFLV